MANKILVYGHYHSISLMLQYWLEMTLPEVQVVVAQDMAQVVELAQKSRFEAVILSVDTVTRAAIRGISTLRGELPTAPIMVLIDDGLSRSEKKALLAEADVCLALDSFQNQLLPLLQNLLQLAPHSIDCI